MGGNGEREREEREREEREREREREGIRAELSNSVRRQQQMAGAFVSVNARTSELCTQIRRKKEGN